MKKEKSVEEFWSKNHLGKGVFDKKNLDNFFLEHSKLSDTQTKFEQYLPDSNIKILDVACGIGYWLDKYNTHSSPSLLIGVDISSSSIELCKKRFEESKVNLIHTSAESLPFQNESFDFVSCHGAIHHMQNPELAIKEISRVLKKDGEIIISVYFKNIFLILFDKSKLFRKFLNMLFGGIKGRGRENFFSSESSKELIRKFDGDDNPIGWAIRKSEIYGFLPSNLKLENTSYQFSPTTHLFPQLPKKLHIIIGRIVPLMIYFKISKTEDEEQF